MWLFCREGFFSAVAHKDRPGYVLVRARCRQDVGRLCDAVGLPREAVQRTPEADYLWRVEVEQDRWAQYVERTARKVDYPNFKDAVHGEVERDTAYMHVWAAMHKFQGAVG